MLKLYKDIDGTLHYWETWDENSNTGIVHWGIIGEKGQSEKVKSDLTSKFKTKIQEMISKKTNEGYHEIEDMYTLLIEYKIEGMGTSKDLKKRHKLEDRMNETLGWTGLGHCDGGSIGSGTMESCCFVVDFDIAKKVIEEDLKDTQFANYNRIYDENAE